MNPTRTFPAIVAHLMLKAFPLTTIFSPLVKLISGLGQAADFDMYLRTIVGLVFPKGTQKYNEKD